jgi:hypothetical protein
MNQDELQELSKMTKAEIIKHFEHLGSAVDAKNDEIVQLRKAHKLEIAGYDNTIQSYKERLNEVETRTETIIKAKLDEAKQSVEAKYSNVKGQITELSNLVKTREAQLAKAIGNYESIVKILQGTADIHSDAFALLTREIRGE